MDEKERMDAIEEVAILTGKAREILEELLDEYGNDKIGQAIETAFVYLGDIAGNMWAILEDRPEDIEEL